jgi:hypothetical protein
MNIGPDLLDLILAARGDDKTSKFTDEEIFEESLTFGKYSFFNFNKRIFLQLSLVMKQRRI